MKRKEFKLKFIEELIAKGITPEDKIVDSAMGKTARHASAKYGSANWDYEYGESGVQNAMYFYGEYGTQDTFNRQGYQQSRKS